MRTTPFWKHSIRWRQLGLALALLGLLAAGLPAARPAQALTAGWRALTGRLPAHVSPTYVLISPDSQYLVFQADIDVDGTYDLYSVPLAGGPLVKLNPPLVAGGQVINQVITPDSSRVIYSAEQELDERRELYSVPIGGGEATKLNGSLPAGGNVSAYLVDAGSARVVYLADENTNDVFELFSLPQAGGTLMPLNPTLAAGGDVYYFDIDATGQRVIYDADQDTNDLNELYTVPIGGGPSVKISPTLDQSIFSGFRPAPGFAYAVYIANDAGGANADELWGNDTPGGLPRKRNYILGASERVANFKVSPTGVQIVYSVGLNSSSGSLWRAQSFAGSSQQLSEAGNDPGFGVGFYDFQITPDGSRAVWAYQKDAVSAKKLQSAIITGGPLNRVDLYVPATGHTAYVWRVSPDSQWVLLVDHGAGSDYTLVAVPTAGGSPVYLGAADRGEITPDSSRVIFQADSAAPGYKDVLSVQIFGGGLRNLSRVHLGENVYDYHLSPDGQAIVYTVQFSNGETQLRVSDGQAAPPVFDVFAPAVRR